MPHYWKSHVVAHILKPPVAAAAVYPKVMILSVVVPIVHENGVFVPGFVCHF